jgi:enoyl-CoA hydratase/carnithine racemase
MAPIPALFSVPIARDPHNPTAAPGSITCAQVVPSVYLISFSSTPDNRLTPPFNAAFLLALDILEHRFPKGVLITTSSIPKFYSNGLDYDNAIKDPTFFSASLFPLWHRLLTYPMPTIALLNGHAFAGGLMLAMFHDYRVMNPHKGFLCLNELDFGAQLRPAMASIFRAKVSMSTFRNMVLESRRYPALEAMKEGLVDGLGSVEECLAYIHEYKLVDKAKSPSYGKLKEELYREGVKDLRDACEDGQFLAKLDSQRELQRGQLDVAARQRVEQYEQSIGRQRAKL